MKVCLLFRGWLTTSRSRTYSIAVKKPPRQGDKRGGVGACTGGELRSARCVLVLRTVLWCEYTEQLELMQTDAELAALEFGLPRRFFLPAGRARANGFTRLRPSSAVQATKNNCLAHYNLLSSCLY